jgi:hypothetical protein
MMKTDDLVSMLARGALAVEPGVPQRRYAWALAGGVLGAALLMVFMLGVRSDLAHAVRLPMFWVKLGFPAALLAAALLAALRLSRPGAALRRAPGAIAAPVIAMWLLAAVALLGAAPGEREQLIFGVTWASCPFNVSMLSAPAFIAVLWAMKGLAPTRLALAGAAAGLLAGATGAVVYTLHCPEMAAPFLGIWYVLGMAIPAAVGAVIGPSLLRW